MQEESLVNELKASFLVLLEINDEPTNALQFVINMAKLTDAEIELFCVIDLSETITSENQIAAMKSMRKADKKVQSKLTDLVQLIEAAGVVAHKNVAYGRVEPKLKERLAAKLSQNLVVSKKNYKAIGKGFKPIIKTYPGNIFILDNSSVFHEKIELSTSQKS
jgi:hypothetical protein